MSLLLVSLSFLFLSGCASTDTAATPTPTNEVIPPLTDLPPSPTDSPDDPDFGWQTYNNPDVGISFQFPPSWYGPVSIWSKMISASRLAQTSSTPMGQAGKTRSIPFRIPTTSASSIGLIPTT